MHTPSPPQQIAHIRIIGLPLEFRSISNIKEIVDHLGLVLEIEENSWQRLDLSYCGAIILTKSMVKINEEIIISSGSYKFNIGITEDRINWNPFDRIKDLPEHNFVPDDVDYSDELETEDDEDGVSDTWTNNHDNMYEEGEIIPDYGGGDDGAEKPMDVHESPVATPVVDRSLLNDDEVGGQFQNRLTGIGESSRRDEQNNNNNFFVFNAVNDNGGPTAAVSGEARDRFNGLLNNRSFGPFPSRSFSGDKRILPKLVSQRPNLVSHEWIINPSLEIQTNKRFRVESARSPSQEASIDLIRDILLSNDSMENADTVDGVPDSDRLEALNVEVVNEQQMTAEIGNLLGIDVTVDNEILKDVMGEGANNGLP
ncbi:hypothetical protein L1887_22446 [Cichorium endivia]|nr:hypothetical protein L1887_22446 [Cichorium endivia]